MESSAMSSGLLARWQHLQLQDRLQDGVTPEGRADIIRGLMTQIQQARACKIVSPPAAADLFGELGERYSNVLDVACDQGGVNNYADGVLALLEGRRNESKKWTCSLKFEDVKKLPAVKNLLQSAQATYYATVPEGGEQDRLVMNTPEDGGTSALTRLPQTGQPQSSSSFAPADQPRCNPHGKQSVTQPASSRPAGSGNPEIPAFNSGVAPGDRPTSVANNRLFPDPSRVEKKRSQGADSGAGIAGHGPDSAAGFWNLHGRSAPLPGSDNSPSVGDPGYSKVESGSHTERHPGVSAGFSRIGDNSGDVSRPNQTLQTSHRKLEKRPRAADFEDEDDDPGMSRGCGLAFRTAREQLAIDSQKKFGRGGGGGGGSAANSSVYGTNKKSLGTRRGLNSKFVPPVLGREDEDDGGSLVRRAGPNRKSTAAQDPEEPVDERLKNIEAKMVELITSEIMDHGAPVTWDDIAGLQFAKKTIKEIVVWPMLRPDIFTGLRGPPKGLLLFGPPGTGKTLIGKCIASQSKSTFFSISASSLTSKWVGEGEKMVRALFAVARVHQPSVIFIDEIDSLLSQRSDGEHEASRKIKTEFLVQLDGATTGEDDRILVVGATNRPHEIDEAARRRFVKRLYIPLPENEARRHIVVHLMTQQQHHLSEEELDAICADTDGYSGADMANLCREAALGPIRSMSFGEIENITADQVRPIVFCDFQAALKQVRASVSEKDLDLYLEWNKQYGSWGI